MPGIFELVRRIVTVAVLVSRSNLDRQLLANIFLRQRVRARSRTLYIFIILLNERPIGALPLVGEFQIYRIIQNIGRHIISIVIIRQSPT